MVEWTYNGWIQKARVQRRWNVSSPEWYTGLGAAPAGAATARTEAKAAEKGSPMNIECSDFGRGIPLDDED